MKYFVTVLALLMPSAASAGPDWQCGRDYIIPHSKYSLIYRYQTAPLGEAEDIWLNPGPPMGSPAEEKILACVGKSQSDAVWDACTLKFHRNLYQWKGGHYEADGYWNMGKLYYRGKPCKAVSSEN